jgi:hypothetical protein
LPYKASNLKVCPLADQTSLSPPFYQHFVSEIQNIIPSNERLRETLQGRRDINFHIFSKIKKLKMINVYFLWWRRVVYSIAFTIILSHKLCNVTWSDISYFLHCNTFQLHRRAISDSRLVCNLSLCLRQCPVM